MVVGSSKEGEGESDAASAGGERDTSQSPLSYLCAPLGAPLLRCAYGHPSLPPCCFGCPAPRKHVSQLREETFSGPRATPTEVGKF